MVRRKNRLLTDAIREVRHTYSRFLSILVLSALAVAFLVGLRATSPDMEYTADGYYDRNSLMDGYIQSTMGLTEEDMEALSQAEGVDRVEGSWSMDATAVDSIVSLRSMPQSLNLLTVERGRLPQAEDECVTEELLLVALGLDIGDTLEVTLEEGQEGELERTSFTIVGTVTSPLYVSTDRGTTGLGSGSVDAFVYIPAENFHMEVYTAVYFTGQGLAELDSYSDAYDQAMTELVDSLDGLAREREALRDAAVRGEAQEQLDQARQELAEAEEELAQAKADLEEARAKLDDGWAEYEQGVSTLESQVAQGYRELAQAKDQLIQAQESYDQGLKEYQDGLAQYEEGWAQYQAGLTQYQEGFAQLDAQQLQVDQGYEAYWTALAPYEGTPVYDALVEQLAGQKAALDEAQAQLNQGWEQLGQTKAVLDATLTQLNEAKAELDQGKGELDSAQAQIAAGQQSYDQGLATLRQEEAQGRQELAQAKAQLEDGEAEYTQGLEEYEEALAEAEPELAQAREDIEKGQQELDDMEPCQWYVLGRDTNVGIVSYAQDAQRVENLAAIFPVIFFVVAALACLTTMTRMVEEQRTQIGALKALGFSRLAISFKYIGYAFFASLLGGIIGLVLGATIIPAVIANAFAIMYSIPGLEYRNQPLLFFLAILAAVGATTGAAVWACLSTLIDTPANLMRPKAPKAGRRVFLEYIKPVWRAMSFTWKVTMRNLFRYQKRFWMTVIGIGGCTALIVTGFGLHESIFDVLDIQFDEISNYDATVGVEEDMTEEQHREITDYLDENPQVEGYLFSRQTSLDISGATDTHTGYLFVVEDGEKFSNFIHLCHRKDDDPVTLSQDGVVITEKLSELLDVSVGDTITLKGEPDVEVTVSDITENYVYHYVYMTEDLYTQLVGEEPKDNVILLDYTQEVENGDSDATSAQLMAMDGVASYSYISTIRDSFTDSMSAVNYAVMIIIGAAAALAFVVLYNLTNINITERMRELATLKVLGFYDRETSAYIYRENIFLTIFGIILGLVMGRLLHSWMVLTVEVDLVMFGRTAPPYAYVLAAALTVLFSVIVNVAAHFRLKKVDMVVSLKAVE